ncbi:MAG: outer membrane protein assembly factor BamD [Candidatus Cloacimonetes bacterium]|nr:outer membrane protein assembly factor BamD [Candidatus Cloacimonadota bacterium]
MAKKIFYGIMVLIILSACSGNRQLKQSNAAEAMKIADAYVERGKLKKAIPFYEKIINESNSILMAEAQMKLADCYFQRHDYIDARFEYEEFIRRFSDSRDVAKAFYKIGVCYFELSLAPHYDQTETFSAIDAFTEYIDRFPFDERKKDAVEYINKCRYKLLEKRYYNGYAYYKISDFPSALLYFEEIIALNNLNELDKKSRYYSTMMYIVREDIINASEMAETFYTRYDNTPEARKLRNKIANLEKKLQKRKDKE